MVTFEIDEQKLVCCFTGRMDTVASQAISSEIEKKLADETKAVEFDLAGVEYVSSAFLRICISAQQTMGEKKLFIINVRPMVKKVFMIAGFDKLMQID